MENQTVTTVEEIIEESISLSSAKEAYELPTDYKASWELEKGIREALERENKELKKLKKRIEYSEKEIQAAWEQKYKAENDFLTTKTELNNERGVSIQLRKDFNEAVSRVDKLDGENKKLTDNLSKLQIQHNNLKESNLSLRKAVINYSSRSTTYLYLSIFLGFVSVVAAIVIFLLLNI